MKFKNTLDEVQYKMLGLNEMEVRKRIGMATIKKSKDQKASRNMRNQWRRNKAKYIKGIKKWTRSTAGKRFHRALGRFNALRESTSGSTAFYNQNLAPGQNYVELSMTQVNDALLGLSSIETHLYLELQYYEADAEAMVQFLDMLNDFLEDASILKKELLEAYVYGKIEAESYGVLTDIIQFFQDPKMYMYAKRDLAGMRNDQGDEIFRAMLQASKDIDFLKPANEIYDELDEKFEELIKLNNQNETND